MANEAGGANIVEELRIKTEKNDITQYLKSTLGGYTKASVLEYLNTLRKQQQAMAETFSRNQQTLFNEKEALKKENETLTLRTNRAEAEYQNLLLSVTQNDGIDDDENPDVPALRNRVSALEEEIKRYGIENDSLNNQLVLKEKTLEDLHCKIKTFEEESLSLKEMLKAEMLESKKQRSLVAKLAATIEERDSEIRALNALMSESELLKQNEIIGHLTERLSEQNELIKKYNEEKEINLKTIKSLGEGNEALRNNILRLKESYEETASQNERLSFVINTLSRQLEEEYKKSIALIREKSATAVEKMTVERKLGEANSRISLLELQIKKASPELYELNKEKELKAPTANLIIFDGILKSSESK